MTNAQKNRIIDKSFQAIGVICTFFGLVILAILIYNIIIEGAARIDWDFMKDLPSRRPQKAGIYTAVMGTIWILVLTTLIAFPVGVGCWNLFGRVRKENETSFVARNKHC